MHDKLNSALEKTISMPPVCLGQHSIQLENRIQIKWIISFPSPIAPLRNEFDAEVLPASRLFICCLLAAFFPPLSHSPVSYFFGWWAQHFVHFLWLLHIYAIKIANMPQRSHTTPPRSATQFASCRHKASNHAANEAYAQFLFFLLCVNIAYNKNEFKNHFKFPFSIQREGKYLMILALCNVPSPLPP